MTAMRMTLKLNLSRRYLPCAVVLMASAVPTALGQGNAPPQAKTVPGQTLIAEMPKIPQWQTAAGGKMSFAVASVRQSKPDSPRRDNMDLRPLDLFLPTGGLFTANVSLVEYIIFAYKITDTSQYESLRTQLPNWTHFPPNKFDIQARAEGNPTKDQMRLMMQALLADRFKLAIHTETRQLPVYALVLDKPGKLGPQLQPHPSNVSCPDIPTSAVAGPAPPPVCGLLQVWPVDGQLHFRMMNVSMAVIAGYLTDGIGRNKSGLDHRPIIDRTGLGEKFDFNLEFLPEPKRSAEPGADAAPEADSQPEGGSGPTFTGALKNQLGLKLIKQTGPVDVYIIDHIEMPSLN
jgi:uncharacterized protein (TIGR03435 family)